MTYDLITLLGPTATGKTVLAVKLAHKYKGEIISADSRQVYKFMNIGTGKDLDEYRIGDEKINYHLIDILHPSEEFNVFKFQELFYEAYNFCRRRNRVPFLVGGSGLYLHSVLKGYEMPGVNREPEPEWEQMPLEELSALLKTKNPNLHNTTDLMDRERVTRALLIAESDDFKPRRKINSLILGIRLPREEIKKRITARLKSRLNSGMIEEAENLLRIGIPHEKLEFFGLEYKFLSRFLKGELNYNDMYQKLNSAIHSFAKRQMTWFRKMEREGVEINWIDGPNFEQASQIIETKFLQRT